MPATLIRELGGEVLGPAAFSDEDWEQQAWEQDDTPDWVEDDDLGNDEDEDGFDDEDDED